MDDILYTHAHFAIGHRIVVLAVCPRPRRFIEGTEVTQSLGRTCSSLRIEPKSQTGTTLSGPYLPVAKKPKRSAAACCSSTTSLWSCKDCNGLFTACAGSGT